jgi:succinate dehydrogenase / fumarate reductase flavoprotein subunit
MGRRVHASRMLGFGSSLVDLAIYRESKQDRRVFMDFNRNPLPGPDGLAFGLDRLDDDVAVYLRNAGADQDLPIDRLRHMNPLAIELYRRYKVDISADPLEFAVNNQHMNGGIAVDSWGRSNIGGIFAIGEAAGTHGATRPGGCIERGTSFWDASGGKYRCRWVGERP